MTRVSEHYGLRGQLPFLDVHVEYDSPLFLDPTAIRHSRGQRAREAQRTLEAYFSEVLRCRTGGPALRTAGRRLLEHLHEPNETRLGLSVDRVRGKAFDFVMSGRLWDALDSNPAARVAALTKLEDLPVFVDRVGDDLLSDMTTRVIFGILANFTADMMVAFPALSRGAKPFDVTEFDRRSGRWSQRMVVLPHCSDSPLLLVPKDWVYWRALLDPRQFYSRFATQTVQDERTTWILQAGKRKRVRPRKEDLYIEFPEVKQLNNAQVEAYMLARQQRNLVEEYRTYVDETYVPMDDEALDARLL